MPLDNRVLECCFGDFVVDIKYWDMGGVVPSFWIGQTPLVEDGRLKYDERGELELTTLAVNPEDYVGLVSKLYKGLHVYEKISK